MSKDKGSLKFFITGNIDINKKDRTRKKKRKVKQSNLLNIRDRSYMNEGVILKLKSLSLKVKTLKTNQ